MTDAIQHALDSIADGGVVDWAALEAQTPEASRPTLRSLREIAAIGRAHSGHGRQPTRVTPFDWGFLRVDDYVASGAHGDVYRAWDPRLERAVALKLLRDDEPGEDLASLAISEGRLLARVRHPNVVTVHGADRIDGCAGIWMEFVEGRTLRQEVGDDGPLQPAAAAVVGLAICDGLAAIHAAGLTHRDVKAQNVIRDGAGRITLMDLGGGGDDHNPDGRVEGTPVYLAPEVLRGDPASTASDIYAVGVLLFFVVTGRYPVAAASLEELRAEHEAGRREPLEGFRTHPAFSAAIDRALSPDPAARFASAAEMRTALEAVHPVGQRRYLTTAPIAAATFVIGAIACLAWFADPRSNGVSQSQANRVGSLTSAPALPAAPPSTPSQAPPASAAPLPQIAPSPPQAVTPKRPEKLRLPDYDLGVPSHDGRFYPYVDWSGNVGVWDVNASRGGAIITDGSSTESARSTLMSPHGDRVVYGWAWATDEHDLRIVGADGRWQRTILTRQSAYEPIPLDWSRDEQTLLCWFHQKNGSADLVLVTIADGQTRAIHTSEDNDMPSASLSPDGRFVVTSRPSNEKAHREVVIIPVDGSGPRVLVAGLQPEPEPHPTWTANGREVVFLRLAEGFKSPMNAWAIPTANGFATDKPALLAENVGSSGRVNLNDDGTLYVALLSRSNDAYIATVDLVGDAHPGPPVRIAPSGIGHHSSPSWSPDGQSIAYFSSRVSPFPGTTPSFRLTILDRQSGAAHTLEPLAFQGSYTPRWHPDGQSIVVWGADIAGEKSRYGYYRINVRTGERSPVVLFPRKFPPVPGHFDCSPDGRALLYIDDARGIVSHDFESHREVVVVDKGARRGIGRFAVSPDGQSIAFLVQGEGFGRAIELQTNVEPPRELIRSVPGEGLDLQALTPDGASLIFTRISQISRQLWRMPMAGGEARDMHFRIRNQPNPITVSPDGRFIAYPERTQRTDLRIVPLPLAAGRLH